MSETLEDALSLAYEKNPVIEGERSLLKSLDEDVSSASSRFFPSIGISTSYGHEPLVQFRQYVIRLEVVDVVQSLSGTVGK